MLRRLPTNVTRVQSCPSREVSAEIRVPLVRVPLVRVPLVRVPLVWPKSFKYEELLDDSGYLVRKKDFS